jgi:Fur family ferric uptake transcriptional regulator
MNAIKTVKINGGPAGLVRMPRTGIDCGKVRKCRIIAANPIPEHICTDAIMSKASDLKDAGLKATGPRLKILNLFETSDQRHLTAEDVYRMLLDEQDDVGLATVYRVLTQFEQAGLLVRHHFESGKAVFELNQGGHHDHLVCVKCGKVEEFYDAEIEKRQDTIAKKHNFMIQDHAMYLYGICAECQTRLAGKLKAQ